MQNNRTVKRVFAAFPFSEEYSYIEDAIKRGCEGVATVECAKDLLTNKHILDKILGQMRSADLCLFDLSGHNVNVALELGVAIGADLNWRIMYDPSKSSNGRDIFSDMSGRDSARYKTADELSERVRSIVIDERNYHVRPSVKTRKYSEMPLLQATLRTEQTPGQSLAIVFEVRNVAFQTVATDVRIYVGGVGSLPGIAALPAGDDKVAIRERLDNKIAYSEHLKIGRDVIVEFADVSGAYYKQVGELKQEAFSNGAYSISMDGLGRPQQIEESRLLRTDVLHLAKP